MPDIRATPDAPDAQRPIHRTTTLGDRLFRGTTTAMGVLSFLVVASAAGFLFVHGRPALKASGWHRFLLTTVWNQSRGRFGLAGLVIGTLLIALVALAVAVPIALGTAVFVNEYAPARIRRPLVLLVDMLAALPSLVFGMWGLFALQGFLVGPARWIATYLPIIPIFRVPDAGALLASSSFTAGVVVAVMIIPIITSVTRDVMAQCPREQCEAALALGGSRSGMVRSVILPFGRSGIAAGILLGFGRAIGETIAVALVLSLVFKVQVHILQAGGGSIAALIATQFGESNQLGRSALVAAGFALFVMTLFVTVVARTIVNRTARVAV